MRWKRINHWKEIRALVDENGATHAWIHRGRRPGEYTIVFSKGVDQHFVRNRWLTTKQHPDYTITNSDLKTAKAVGMLLVKTN